LTDESDFIKSLLNQKEKAFKKLLDLYQKRLYWHIRKMVLTHENANDVLQNTFLRIYKSLPGFKQNSSLNTWMFRIAYNESLRFLEQEKKKKHSSIDDLSTTYINNLVADSFFEGDAAQLKLQSVLALLADKDRQIFQMKYYDNLKFHEIADILEINQSTLKTSYYRTVKRIEKNIETIACFNEMEV
jgi:RNA polymerase sigma factor (sigma-70 family)